MSESYKVRYARRAARQLSDELPAAVAFAAAEFIGGPLADNPHRVGKRLLSPLAHLHSARRGTFRILYQIDVEAQSVLVVAIEHRADAYRT